MIARRSIRRRLHPRKVTDRIDWFRVLVQCQRAGKPLHVTAARTGISQPQLRGYMHNGEEPAHWRGEALLAFWCEATGKGRDSAPKLRR